METNANILLCVVVWSKSGREIAMCFPQVLPAVVNCSAFKFTDVILGDCSINRGRLLDLYRKIRAALVGGVTEYSSEVPQLHL